MITIYKKMNFLINIKINKIKNRKILIDNHNIQNLMMINVLRKILNKIINKIEIKDNLMIMMNIKIDKLIRENNKNKHNSIKIIILKKTMINMKIKGNSINLMKCL